eukprot:tig00000792_g4172.t1
MVHGHAIDLSLATPAPQNQTSSGSAALAPDPSPALPAPAAGAASAFASRTVRVFLSSTFQDMGPERAAIFASAVPRLRRALDPRGLFFVPVDLRWGITKEAAESGEVLRLCLEEVERSTYFVAFLKRRYGGIPGGWHQPADGPRDPLLAASFERAAERFPFVWGYADRSATELEILLGALFDPQGAPRVRAATSRFYFASGGEADSRESEAAQRLLESLKGAVRGSGLPVRAPDYGSAEELAAAIHDDVLKMVERDFPRGGERSWLEEERLAHAAFGDARRRVYVPHAGAAEALDAYAAGDGPELMLVVGTSGCGKSAMLANWAHSWQERQPGDVTLVHFVGGSQQSSRLANLMRRVYESVRAECPEAPEMDKPMREGGLEEMLAFRGWLEAAARALQRRLVLAIDALDQLLDDAGAQRLHWLPPSAGAKLRIVLSCVPGHGVAYESARQRAHVLHEVAAMAREQRLSVAQAELAASGKALAPATLERLCGAPQSGNPLFLLTVLGELRDAAVHANLEGRLDACLACPDPVALFGLVMQRWGEQYGEHLVREALAAVWCSRHGMADGELQQLLRIGAEGSSCTPLRWCEFTSAAMAVLISRDGLLGFFHRSAAEAAEATFGLADAAERRQMHARLGSFFAAQPPSQRRAEEGPWALARAEERDQLVELLSDLDILARLGTDGARHELVQLWVQSARQKEAAGRYTAAIDSLKEGDISGHLLNASELLRALGEYQDAEPICRRVLEMTEAAGGDSTQTATALHNLAFLLQLRGKYGEAEPLYMRSLEIKEATLGESHPEVAKTLNELALMLGARIQFDKAEPLYKRALAIREAALGESHPLTATVLNNLALLLFYRRKFDEAEPLYRRALAIREAALGELHTDTATSVNNLGVLLVEKKKLDEAEPLYRRVLAIKETTVGPNHPDTAMSLHCYGRGDS